MRAPCHLVLCALFLAACASGKPGNKPDAGEPQVDAPEGPPLKGFGEPCTDKKQCASNACLAVGTTGQCTRVCPPDCPDGYGCLDVIGAVIEGQAGSVCVPISNQLCTTCAQDSECTLIGMDKCVTYPDGDRACARDCESVSCPVGYACQNVVLNGQNYKQCLSTSGACDCTAKNPGAMQPCNIMTPWNVCLGSQTCAGATGWGACQPPSPNDDPDDTFTDTNCDGIDGDRSRAIFVALGGTDQASCGLDYTSPCQTIGFGLSRAAAVGRPHVYVQNGDYNVGSTLVMKDGVSVFGGFNINWRRNSYAMAGHVVRITGGATAVRFDAITQPTFLDNIIVRSANAGSTGGSTTAILVTSSRFVQLRSVRVEPGVGAVGAVGTDGMAGIAGYDGFNGRSGCQNDPLCPGSCSRPLGGAGGGSACMRNGGEGGQPGLGGGWGFDGAPGTGGTPGGLGAMCSGSRTCDGAAGSDGASGDNGSPGGGGASMGTFSGFTYVPANGSSGGAGTHGNGGGGGGGGGGGSNGCDSFGSSGGGGGGGGCAGTSGTGGGGAGGSFGVIALDSDLLITNSSIQGGQGGQGGRGGFGGAGGVGGLYGEGGLYGGSGSQDDGGDGTRGGLGGAGGNGGTGGGGGGGPSIAVVCLGTSTTTVTISGSVLSGGTGGAGGSGTGMTGMTAMSYGCP